MDFVELLEKILSSGEVSAVKFFKKAEFTFSQKEEAEKALFRALEIINSKNDIHAVIAKRLLCNFDNFIGSFSVEQFWSSVRVREEKTTTNTAQIILQEKEEQNACQIRTNMLEENIKLLTAKRRIMYDFEENRTTKRIQKEDDDKLTFDDKSETDSNVKVHFGGSKVFDPKFVLAKSDYKGDIFPDDIKIEKPIRLNIIPPDDSSQETDDDEDIPLEESFISTSSSSEIWTLPSGQNVGNIYASKIFENTRATKKKKKLTAVEKAILRYGASNIIDLSAHMKEWFCVDDRKFMSKDYESMLQIPELAPEESSFVLKVEESEDQVNILDFTLESTHTEVDVIVKACAYVVEGLCKNLEVYSTWSTNYTNGRKCDVRFLSASGVDVGEWEFSAKVIANKTIGDRCNGLLEYNLNDDQVKNIQVPFLQFGGTCGQLLVEDLVEGFYIVFPGPKFELPIKLRDIGKLKNTINVIKLVIEMYERTCETIENLETFHHKFDDVFNGDYHIVDKSTHFKYKYIRRSWWTPRNSLCSKNDV
ncbi:18471_t:CDS:2 [Gigaspora margarita]|uniref:18471_t:CDS:1 n=1 Tax=Gigaspora margarita TaxID=4874 RepID=A0ABM8W640_GIGMA|nr:18471_t:CDS:2 [Gigaspora margarita]